MKPILATSLTMALLCSSAAIAQDQHPGQNRDSAPYGGRPQGQADRPYGGQPSPAPGASSQTAPGGGFRPAAPPAPSVSPPPLTPRGLPQSGQSGSQSQGWGGAAPPPPPPQGAQMGGWRQNGAAMPPQGQVQTPSGGQPSATYQGQTPWRQPQAQPQNRGGWQDRQSSPPPAPNPGWGRGPDRDRGDYDRGERGDWRGDRGESRGDWGDRDRGDRRDRRGVDPRGEDRRWDGRGGYQRPWDNDGWRREWRSPERYAWRAGRWFAPPGWAYRHWAFGEYVPWDWFAPQWAIQDFWAYGLPAPPWGCVWIRSGPDALMIDTNTGMVIEVIGGVFYW